MVAVAKEVAMPMEIGGLVRRGGRRKGASQVPPWVKHGGGTVGGTAGRLKVKMSSSLDRQVDIKWGYPEGRGLRGLVLWRDPWSVDRVERAVEDVSGRRGSRPSPRKSSFHVPGHPRPSQAWPLPHTWWPSLLSGPPLSGPDHPPPFLDWFIGSEIVSSASAAAIHPS